MEPFTYLITVLLAIAIPLAVSFHRKSHFYGNQLPLFAAMIFVGVLFLIWDVIFTHYGIWSFNHERVVGIFFLGLPMEEYLFFFCIPFACVFTYDFFRQHGQKWGDKVSRAGKIINYVMIAILAVVAVYAYDRIYTFTNALLFMTFLIALARSSYARYSGFAYIAYIPLLLPFFLVNGTLTGAFTETPVVYYNDLENLGIRLGTIPVEDVFYGLFLIKANIVLFHQIKGMQGREVKNLLINQNLFNKNLEP